MRGVSYLAALVVVSTAFPVVLAWAAPEPPSGSTNQHHRRATLQTFRDVAVTSIQSSSFSVPQGEAVDIDVTVQNLGDGPESFGLTLRDDTNLQDLHTVQITLDAGQTLIIGFRWDTSSATAGSHSLSATASLVDDHNPSNNTLGLLAPITIELVRITIDPLTPVDAIFGEGLAMAQPNVTTQKTPSSNVFLGGQDASYAGPLERAAVATQGTPHQSIFVANADATFQPGKTLQNPFQRGEIRGVVRLEGNQSSLGGYVLIGQDTHFVQSDGSFRVMVPAGAYDIFLKSPGHVPAHIPNTSINPGEVLTLPEMTLPFGDANGDGRIDILDLSIAASNFGETVVQVPPP